MREEDVAVIASALIHNGELLPSLYTAEELNGLVAPLADLAANYSATDFTSNGNLEIFFYHRIYHFSFLLSLMHATPISIKYLVGLIVVFTFQS